MTTRTATRTQFLTDVLTTAVEGGIGYWAQVTSYTWDTEVVADRGVTITDVEDSGAIVRVTVANIATALGKFTKGTAVEAAAVVKVHPSYVRQIRTANRENDGGEIDADLADMVLQVAALGEVIYG